MNDSVSPDAPTATADDRPNESVDGRPDKSVEGRPNESADDLPGESIVVETNGISLHTRQAGPEDGPLVILLHGFPEFWYGWHRQIEPLAAAGYRVIVPDQRGYNRSDKPEGVDSYHIEELAADVVSLIDAADRETAAVAGHDWGAAVAWWLALAHPDRIESLTAVNVPHPTVMEATLRRSLSQLRKSWYMFAFQLPMLPEAISTANNCRALQRGLTESSRSGTFSATDIQRYRTAWTQPGAVTAMINWYRAMGRYRPRPPRQQVSAPTLIMWGQQDEFLESAMAEESLDYCDDGRLVTFPSATHWVLHERPEETTQELRSHIESNF
ncbi:alpha/beta fold hydrolase [Halonotius roseus]|uniref:Alpha/beta hydrolase n=1 Tax=Halonotius roseus TaxID=2511997 RepID=A0A544QM02_9EURY|nr:alpha/beta hydrolase [Halonotius roseus]TQQ79629.1 alpha/beta hydrolase [Halonotius roseus]